MKCPACKETIPEGNSQCPKCGESFSAAEELDSTITDASGSCKKTHNTFFGPYKLLGQLGKGGQGEVYLAEQVRPFRRLVALKVIRPGMDSEEVIARFESERQALAMMEHPNIAHVFDAATDSMGRPYFVMELVERGVPITDYCDSKSLTLRERVELFMPVCHAIQHAHQKGIIHRDIKPSNVLVEEREDERVPKVIDFGLAKALGHMERQVGTVVGTPDYMSPEQAELGRYDVDTRSDVYSLGAVLYELLTGAPPLELEATLATQGYDKALERIRKEEPLPPSTRLQSTTSTDVASKRRSKPARLPKLLHGDLDWIVMKTLEKSRMRRYETVNGLARDLQHYLDGEPVEAAPPSATYHVRKLIRKHRLPLATAAAFAVLLVAGVVVSSWMAVRASRAEQVARAVNDFLQNDLLAQASANKQARPDIRPDPDLKVRTALDRAAAQIEGKFEAQPLVEASIRQTIGNTYTDLGLYPDAQRELESALKLRRRILGEQHPETLVSMNGLARAYERQGKYAQAESLYARVLEIQRRVLGEEHPNTLLSMSGLAVVYNYQGRYAQAEALFIKLLDVRRRVLGEDDPETLTSMANLAAVYHFQSKYTQAEPLYTKCLQIRRRVSGEEHPDTLTVMANLAELYRDVGNYDRAEPLYAKVLEIQRRVLGKDHRNTIYSMNSLAALYVSRRKYAQAEKLYADALEASSRVLGTESSFALLSMNGLAELYRDQGKYPEAKALFTRVVDTRRRVLGESHPDTVKSKDELASLGRVQLPQQKSGQHSAKR